MDLCSDIVSYQTKLPCYKAYKYQGIGILEQKKIKTKTETKQKTNTHTKTQVILSALCPPAL